MAKRQYKPQSEVLATPEANSVLPTDRPVAVYYRQSTDAQIGNISTSIQTVDMVEYLERLGWRNNDVVLIDADAGVSGTTKIDEREGMRNLFDLITDKKIGAVACQDEDRLFRDVTQIQVNIFIEACRAAGVQVLTPGMVYDFANPMTGTFHARQFRFKSEMAAEYINSVILGKLHRAKKRIHLEGRWSGAAVAPGYMVDMRKTLPDGSKKENWRRFVPFEPYAEVVNEYFRLFLSYSGNFTATLRHIHQFGPYYPDPAGCPPPEGYKVVYQINRYERGYCPKKQGLFDLLTNAVYLGHWLYQGAVVRWNNHPAIVPEKVFVQAYNYLMDTTLDGKANPHFKPFRQNARPSKEEERPIGRPLCTGMMVSQLDGKWRKVGTNWEKFRGQYKYVLWSNDPLAGYMWGREAGQIDDAIGAVLRDRLAATFDSQNWQATLDTFDDTREAERKSVVAQIATHEKAMENLIASLETLTEAEMIMGAEKRYQAAKEEHHRLQAKLKAFEMEDNRLEAIAELRNNYLPTLENWDFLTHEEKRVVFHTFIRRIEATQIKSIGLRLVIYWVDGSDQQLLVHRKAPTGNTWLPTETNRLLELVDAGATQLEICQAFPARNWHSIQSKFYRERGYVLSPHGHEVLRYETYHDYIARVKATQHTPAKPSEHWTDSEEKLLLSLLERRASDLEIAGSFPRRTWGGIRKKIKQSVGNTFYIKRSKLLRQDETFMMYQERIGQVIHSENGVLNVEDKLVGLSSEDHSPMVSLI